MPRWLWWLPLGMLIVLAALLGLQQGMMSARVTETDVIAHYAARYVADHGGAAQDCAATPGQGEIWIVLHCAPKVGSAVVYPVDRSGRLVPLPEVPGT